MVVAALGFTYIAIIYVLATLGAVLLVRFVMGSGHTSRRVFAAALGGPLMVTVPGLALILFDDTVLSSASAFIGFSMALVIVSCAICWPIAHFATRRLDRLTQFDPQVFE